MYFTYRVVGGYFLIDITTHPLSFPRAKAAEV
jgi:hypothetical protein